MASVFTNDNTFCFILSLSVGAHFPTNDGSYSGANAVNISVALSAIGTPLDNSRISRARRMFERNKFAPGCSGLAMSWKEKNIAALKQWKGP